MNENAVNAPKSKQAKLNENQHQSTKLAEQNVDATDVRKTPDATAQQQ